MKKLIWIVAFLLVIPVSAQLNDPATAIFQPLEVSNVRLNLDIDSGAQLIFNASPTVCDDLLVDSVVDGMYITVKVFAPVSDTTCNTVEQFEPSIALPELETGQAYVLFLNDFTSTFYLTDTDEEFSIEPFAALWGEDSLLIDFVPIEPVLTGISFSPDGDNIAVEIEGDHPDGCETEEYTRVWQDAVQSNLYHIDAFRLLSLGVMCPTNIQPYSETRSLDLGDGDVLEIGGRYYQIQDGEPFQVTRSDLTVTSVEILPTAEGGIIVVQGEQTQDCGVDTTVSLSERDFMSMIDIVMYIPQDSVCTDEVIAYEESFTVSALPVVINGTGYDENGVIVPMASSQSADLPSEGNVMPVDTVIESVEVAILESSPMQIQLAVSGFQPDGCDFPVEIEQTVDGNDVTLHIFRNVPADAFCPMVVVPFDETITVDGTFTDGTVNIQINEFTTSVDL